MNSLSSSIVEHHFQINKLVQAFKSKRLHHAYLFSGPESVGKYSVALALTQFILCEKNNDKNEACAECGSCLRVAKKKSENILFIEPDGTQIKIDQTRQILDFLSLTNFGRPRVIIIDQAQSLNAQSSNALLKILEEPQADVHFFMITSDSQMIMPTIRSRTQLVRFNRLSIEALKQIKPDLLDWIYYSSRGQIDRCLVLADQSKNNRRVNHLELLQHFFNTDFLLKSDWRNDFKSREEMQNLIDNWILFLRDFLVLKIDSNSSIINSDQKEKIFNLKIKTNARITKLISALMQSYRELQGHADAVLLMEKLWVQHALD